MNLNWFQCLVMGFVSGAAGLLPISAEAHQEILYLFCGVDSADAFVLLAVHLAGLIMLLRINRNYFSHLYQTNQLLKIPARRRKANLDLSAVCTIRLFKSTIGYIVIGKLLAQTFSTFHGRLALLAVGLLINGILLYIPGLLPVGNKDSRNMLRLDGMLMGLGASLCVIPGISSVGASLSLGTARGVDRRFALNFTWLLLAAGLVVDLLFDLVAVAGALHTVGTMTVVCAALGALGAVFGVLLAGKLMKMLAERIGFAGFAYYSWGMALFSFILFLMF